MIFAAGSRILVIPSHSFESRCKDLQPLLFQLSQPLNDLGEALLRNFAGRMLTVAEVYRQHNVDTPYVKKNYKDALIKLEAEAKIVADPPAANRRRGTMGDGVKVTLGQHLRVRIKLARLRTDSHYAADFSPSGS